MTFPGVHRAVLCSYVTLDKTIANKLNLGNFTEHKSCFLESHMLWKRYQVVFRNFEPG